MPRRIVIFALALFGCAGPPFGSDASVDDAAQPFHLAPACEGGHAILDEAMRGGAVAELVGGRPVLARAPTDTLVASRGPVADELPPGMGGAAGIVDPETGDLYWTVLMDVGRIRADGDTVWTTRIPDAAGEYGLSMVLDLTAQRLVVQYEGAAGLFTIATNDGAIHEVPLDAVGRITPLADGRFVGLDERHAQLVLADTSGERSRIAIDPGQFLIGVDCDRLYLRSFGTDAVTITAITLEGAILWASPTQPEGPNGWPLLGPEGLTFLGDGLGARFLRVTREGVVQGSSVRALAGQQLRGDRDMARLEDSTVVARIGDTLLSLSPDLVATTRAAPLGLDCCTFDPTVEGDLVVQSCGPGFDVLATVRILDGATLRERRSFESPVGVCGAMVPGPSRWFVIDWLRDRRVRAVGVE